jgi:hypothetical protein
MVLVLLGQVLLRWVVLPWCMLGLFGFGSLRLRYVMLAMVSFLTLRYVKFHFSQSYFIITILFSIY